MDTRSEAFITLDITIIELLNFKVKMMFGNTPIKNLAQLPLFLMLIACKPSLPATSDDDLIIFLGGLQGFANLSAADRNELTKDTVDCARIISGMDEDIYKDAGAEFVGMLRTDCREMFDRALKDSQRNSYGFEMDHFESEEFATRLTKLYEVQAEERKTESARVKHEKDLLRAEQDLKQVTKIEEMKVGLRELLKDISTYQGQAQTKCAEASTLRETLKEADIAKNWTWKSAPWICDSKRITGDFDSIREKVERSLEYQHTQGSKRLPNDHKDRREWIVRKLADIDSYIREGRAFLE